MKALTLFLSMLFSLPFALSAQSAGEMLQRVSAAIDNKQWEQAISLFRQAVNTNVEKAEMFYWAGVDKNTDVASIRSHAAMIRHTCFIKNCCKNHRTM